MRGARLTDTAVRDDRVVLQRDWQGWISCLGGRLLLALVPVALVGPLAAQAPRVIPCPSTLEGFHDSATCQLLTGWAWNNTLPTTPIAVEILVDEVPNRTVLANLFRQDLLNAGIGDGAHGFQFIVPVPLRNGVAHSMRVRVSGTTQSLTGSPKTISCTAPTGKFSTIAPCRAVDTRNPVGPLGGPALAAGTTRIFPIGGTCGIPATAEAISLNVTVIDATDPGSLRIFPDGLEFLPDSTGISYSALLTRANNGVIALGAGGLAVYGDQPSGTVQVVVDVNGYFE
jgi:hypothetical protein